MTGGKKHPHEKKRKFELGRPAANTKLSEESRVHKVRTRGGNEKLRALRLAKGNFAWGSENFTHKIRILDVVYNASNNELVRTKTLVKSAIVEVDAAEFKKSYETYYNVVLDKKAGSVQDAPKPESKYKLRQLVKRTAERFLDPALETQLMHGRLLACISSRPGQSGRADGYILEGKELEFYQKHLQAKKKGKKN